MFIRFSCTSCATPVEADGACAGTALKCPRCGAALTVPDGKLGPGIVLGGFHITELLGRGGMGEVYLARQISMDRAVALKILPLRLTLNREMVDDFLNEGRMIARLRHPNIVTAYEAGEDSGIYYLAMAYIPGETLDQVCARVGPLPEQQALTIVRKLAGALAYAWEEHRLLHRDVKPGNVILDAHGEPNLMDFGLSLNVDRIVSAAQPAFVMGTPNYMSPEQLRGEAGIDFRTDMYALGATLYFMLTHRLPFESAYVDDTLRMVASSTLPDPRSVVPAISEACVRLLTVMMARSPAHRHVSWRAVLDDLDRVMSGQLPVRPSPPASDAVVRTDAAPAVGAKDHQHQGVHAPHVVIHRGAARRVVISAPNPAAGPVVERSEGRPGLIAAVIALLVVIGVLVFSMSKTVRDQVQRVASGQPAGVSSPATPRESGQASSGAGASGAELLAAAEEYARTNAGDYVGALERFKRVCATDAGSECAAKAATEIERLEQGRQKRKAESAWTTLQAKANFLVKQAKIEEAVRLLDDYTGPCAAEIAGSRKELAQMLRARLSQPAEGQATGEVASVVAPPRPPVTNVPPAALEAIAGEIAADLLQQDFGAALTRVNAAQADGGLSARADWKALKARTEQVAAMPKLILKSFQDDEGKEVSVGLRAGTDTLFILSVGDGVVKASRRVEAARVAFSFGVAELSPREKAMRLGTSNGVPERAIMRGLLAYEAKDYAAAAKCFAGADTLLAPVLKQRAEEMLAGHPATPQAEEPAPTPATGTGEEGAAKTAFIAILRLAGVLFLDASPEEQARIVRGKVYRQAEVAAIQKGMENFRGKYADTDVAKVNEETLRVLGMVRANEPIGADHESDQPANNGVDEAAAKTAFDALLRLAGILDLGAGPEEHSRTIRSKQYRKAEVAAIQKSLQSFKDKFGGSELAQANEETLRVLGMVRPNSPIGQK